MADFPTSTDPSRLEGRPKNEEKKLPPREFFWDSVALYVVSAIVGLAVIDVVTEFIRNSDVSCYAPSGVVVSVRQEDYINNFCSASLPITEYFPAFIVVHGILVAIPHYLWLNHYGGGFDFFFAQASEMKRTRDEKTGTYSDKNRLIVQQLTLAFATYKRNWMYILYFMKLCGQFFISTAGFFVTVFYFTDFNDMFYCPRNFNSSNNAAADIEFWPFDGQVRCVFNSLRLYSTIRIADMILVVLLILCYSWAILWCLSTHPTELGAKRVAEFSFQSGMSPEYYVHKSKLQSLCCIKICKKCICNTLPCLIGSGPRIVTNLDFLVLKLFRTDSGLGYVFRDMQILNCIKELNDDDLTRTELHKLQRNSELNPDPTRDALDSELVLVNLLSLATKLDCLQQGDRNHVNNNNRADMLDFWVQQGVTWEAITEALKEIGEHEVEIADTLQRNYCSAPTRTVLSRELASANWQLLGTKLGLSQGDQDHVLDFLLQGGVTWEAITKALKKTGEHEVEIADTLQRKYCSDLITPEEITADLQWKFEKRDLFDGSYEPFSPSDTLMIPNSIRGAIVGFSASAPSNELAIYIAFDSPSLGIPSALSRVFERVGVVNFNPSCRTSEQDTANVFSDIVYVSCPENVFSSGRQDSTKYIRNMQQIWDIGKPPLYETGFIVVGPIHKKSHKTAVTLFLTKLCGTKKLKDGCMLLTMIPDPGGADFYECTPPGYFFEPFTRQDVKMKKGTLEWPPTTVQNEENKGCCSITLFQDKPNSFENVLCGDSFYTFDFKLYKYTHTV